MGGAIVPKGTKGKVLLAKSSSDKSVAKARFIVNWDSYDGPGAVIQRSDLRKVEEWPRGKAEWCCKEQDVGCESLNGTVGHYRCDRGDPQAWIADKAKWCCKHKDHGCRAAAGLSTEPPPTPLGFDPVPHTGVTTARPSLRK